MILEADFNVMTWGELIPVWWLFLLSLTVVTYIILLSYRQLSRVIVLFCNDKYDMCCCNSGLDLVSSYLYSFKMCCL